MDVIRGDFLVATSALQNAIHKLRGARGIVGLVSL
jgi:hypothetical protein